MANAEWHRVHARKLPRNELVAEKQRMTAEYEDRYEMSSAEIVALVDSDVIAPDMEVYKWCHGYSRPKTLFDVASRTVDPGSNAAKPAPNPPR